MDQGSDIDLVFGILSNIWQNKVEPHLNFFENVVSLKDNFRCIFFKNTFYLAVLKSIITSLPNVPGSGKFDANLKKDPIGIIMSSLVNKYCATQTNGNRLRS